MSKRLKLYEVVCRGMASVTLGAHVCHGRAFVVAADPSAAYRVVREYLDAKGVGFDHERELDHVRLVAEVSEYPACGTRLFLAPEAQP